MIHVVAIITAKPGMRSRALEHFNAVVPIVRGEDGCIEFGPAVDVSGADPAFGPDVFVAIEKWRDVASLQAHGASPHMAVFREQTADLLEGIAVHVLDPADL